MSPLRLDQAIFCIYCTDTVTLKEEEFVGHMKKVHGITNNINFLLQINFIDKATKLSVISNVKQRITKSQTEQLFECLFCKSEEQKLNLSIVKLNKFQSHLKEMHAIYFEFDLILVMHLMESSNNIANEIVFPNDFLDMPDVFKFIKSHNNYDLNIVKEKCKDMKTEPKYVTKDIVKLEEHKAHPNLNIQENTMENLSEAYVKKHMSGLRFKSSVCPLKFPTSNSLKKHLIQKHSQTIEKGLFCGSCKICFIHERSLKNHMTRHTKGQNFVCLYCKFHSDYEIALRCHVKIKHTANFIGTYIIDVILTEVVAFKDLNSNDLNCVHCKKLCINLETLKNHIRTKHWHGNVHVFQCLDCSKYFNAEYTLRRHVQIHSKETTGSHKFEYKGKLHKCQQCSKDFKTNTELKRHQKTHSTERPFICNHCPGTFKSYDRLDKHIQIHNSERPWKCEECPKTFKKARSLNIHMESHLTDRIHVCKKCNKSYKILQSYRAHMKVHE